MTADSTIISWSQEIIESFYLGPAADIIPSLNRKIIWIDTTLPASINGFAPVCTFLQQKRGLRVHRIRHYQYHLLRPQSDIYIVTGKYRAFIKRPGYEAVGPDYLISLIWQLSAARFTLFHVHISSAATPLPTGQPLSFHGKHAQLHRFSPEEILCIEADNVNCLVHSTTDCVTVNRPISEIEKQLPAQFLRVHRSYIINRNHVSRVYRFAVELSGRMTIPIPEKKYMNVVSEIRQFSGP